MAERIHWTQTPEGRARMAAIQKEVWKRADRKKAAKPKKQKRSRPRKSAAPVPTPKPTPKKLAHAELERLARIGAQQELVELESKLVRLKMFLSIE